MPNADLEPPISNRRSGRPHGGSLGWRRLLIPLVPFVVLLHSGSLGIDFGNHWDEHLQFRLVARTIKTGVLVPGIYNYPTLPYWLTLSTLAPRIFVLPDEISGQDMLGDLNSLRSLERNTAALQKYALEDQGYFLRTRIVFLLVSSLAALWTYLLVVRWRRSIGEALVAACLLAFSWEVAYHARWIAPDVVMTSFTALTVMLMMLASVRAHPRRHLLGAAVAAGLATGTKYQCGLLLLPLLIATYQARARVAPPGANRPARLRDAVQLYAVMVALFTLTFLLCTPGAVLDWGQFSRWLIFTVTHYSAGGHGGYDVAPGGPHYLKMAIYLGTALFSWFIPIAAAAMAFVLVGIWALVRESRARALLLLVFPVIYLVYMGTQRVFIVRNLLVVTPFLAVVAARGVGFTYARLRAGWVRVALVAVVAIGLAINGVWLYAAGIGIQQASAKLAVKDFSRYVAQHPANRIFASVTVRGAMAQYGLDLARLAHRIEDAQELAFYPDEWATFWGRPTNIAHLSRKWFGPYEINWNYYTNWAGFQRIVLVPATAQTSPDGPLKLNQGTINPW